MPNREQTIDFLSDLLGLEGEERETVAEVVDAAAVPGPWPKCPNCGHTMMPAHPGFWCQLCLRIERGEG